MRYMEILNRMESMSSQKNREGMARFGINTKNAYGISMSVLRPMAKEIGKNHSLARQLWSSGKHEARILATLIDDPKEVSAEQADRWVEDFDSWDLCDQCCSNLFARTGFARRKAIEWSAREGEFVKRAGFALIAYLAIHDKKAGDKEFLKFLPVILRESGDERNYVRKAVNWALRQIGKRNRNLNKAAIETAKEIQRINAKSARWISSDALRELTDEKTQKKLR